MKNKPQYIKRDLERWGEYTGQGNVYRIMSEEEMKKAGLK